MILIFLGVVLSVLLGIGVYAGLISSGILPNEQRSGGNLSGSRSTASRSTASSDSGMFGVFPRVPHVFELPQGCLVALIVAALLWVVAWGIVLVLALKLLRST